MEILKRGAIKTTDLEKRVVLLQTLLDAAGYPASIDGHFGKGTEDLVRRFQTDHGLIVDGVVGEKSWIKLISLAPDVFARMANLWLGQADLDRAADKAHCERPTIKAVYEVESKGAGFLGLKPKILFEGHVFWQRLKLLGLNPAQLARGNEDILYPKWTRSHYVGGLAEHDRLARAKAINAEAAIESASWGLFQIMGYNFKTSGYSDANAFVNAMSENEKSQLDAFVNHIGATRFQGKPLTHYLSKRDWASFARAYNGPGYKQNRYDEKLAAAYEAAKQRMA